MTPGRESPFSLRCQKRIREQLRDAITEVKEREVGVEYDKRSRSIRQFLVIDEIEALLDYIDGLERDNEHAYHAYRELTEGRP
jgi:hypothetical protein